MTNLKPKKNKLITSEMMEQGIMPLLFTGGACNIQGFDGPERNPGRDPLAFWLDTKGYSYFDPQIHPETHGREYIWGIDGPQEKIAREQTKLRIYEITDTTIAAVTMMEIFDDARRGRPCIVWFNNGKDFAPIGLGSVDDMNQNTPLQKKLGAMIYSHLQAYVKAGVHLRNELQLFLSDCPDVVFVDNFDELTLAIEQLLSVEKS